MTDHQKAEAKMQYIKEGSVPNYSYDDGGYFGFSKAVNSEQRTQGPEQKTFSLDNNQTNHLMGEIAKDFGASLSDMKVDNGMILLPNGNKIDMQKAWSIING